MAAVCDTGPLIALAKVERLSLLTPLFGEIFIPPSVYHELLAKSGPDVGHLQGALADFLQIASAPDYPPAVRAVTAALDDGESDAIALAYELGTLLVVDERAGRAAARRLNVPVTGVVGVLLRAKQQNLEAAVRPVLERLRRKGYWLSDDLVAAALRLAGEVD